MPGNQRIPRPADAKRAGPAVWEALDPGRRKDISLERVLTALDQNDPRIPDIVVPIEVAEARPAAVLVALFEEDGETRVILTRRSAHLRTHTGEVSFPGGRIDPGEEAVAAALREAAEEVGLEPAAVQIVGQLGGLMTVGRPSVITPFVGVMGDRPELHPNPAEVEFAFDVALADLAADGVHHQEIWSHPRLREHVVHFFDLPHDIVWGATARLLYDLLMLVIGPGPQHA